MSTFQDPIFRGCTRPATFVGVPLIPFLLVSCVFLLAAAWMFYLVSGYVTLFLLMVYVPLLLVMREVTKKDDQRLRQILLRWRMRLRHWRSRALWKAIAYSPIRYKKRSAS